MGELIFTAIIIGFVWMCVAGWLDGYDDRNKDK